MDNPILITPSIGVFIFYYLSLSFQIAGMSLTIILILAVKQMSRKLSQIMGNDVRMKRERNDTPY